MSDKEDTSTKTGDVLARCRENLKIQREAMENTHDIGRMCMEFAAGEQWDAGEEADRTNTNRPMITINRLANPVNIVVNKHAMESSRIKVSPFEDSDQDKAKVINGLIRHIQYSDKSDALDAYSWAFFCLAVCGFGYWRVDAEFVNDQEFDQELVVNKIDDPFSVYLDPDGNYAIVGRYMREHAFKQKYGKEGSQEFGDLDLDPDHEDDVFYVEYWEKTETPVDLYKIETHEQIIEQQAGVMDLDAAIAASTAPQTAVQPRRIVNVTKDELEAIDEETGLPAYPEGTYTILKTRKSKKVSITQYIFSGEEEIEKTDWPGLYIPIIGIFSRKFKMRNGDFFYKPLIYDSIDPQRLHNFAWSEHAELLLQIPKAVWVGAEGQFEGHEEAFDNAHKNPTSRLEYAPVVGKDGQLLPPPQRMPPPQVSQGYFQNISMTAEEMKATTGIWDVNMGAPSAETSGKAILARRQQGDIGTFHFTLACNSGMRTTGLVLVDQIPYRYDGARTIRILGEDMTDEVVRINQSFVDKDGTARLYDLTTGNYDVKIETGANSITRRQDAAENLLEFARVVPSAGAVGADMIVSNLDAEKADELAMRMKAALAIQMPQLFPMVEMLQKGGSVTAMQLQQAQAQIQKLMQAVQQLGKQNQMLQQKVQGSKIQEAQIDAQAGIKKQQIKTAGDIQQEVIKGRFNLQSTPPVAAAGGMRK